MLVILPLKFLFWDLFFACVAKFGTRRASAIHVCFNLPRNCVISSGPMHISRFSESHIPRVSAFLLAFWSKLGNQHTRTIHACFHPSIDDFQRPVSLVLRPFFGLLAKIRKPAYTYDSRLFSPPNFSFRRQYASKKLHDFWGGGGTH